eukprot:4967303-Alexandrium_andersonii.AAC.1
MASAAAAPTLPATWRLGDSPNLCRTVAWSCTCAPSFHEGVLDALPPGARPQGPWRHGRNVSEKRLRVTASAKLSHSGPLDSET